MFFSRIPTETEPPPQQEQRALRNGFMNSGLQTSIWASKDHENVSLSRRPADWTCTSCNFANFHWRVECFRCGLSHALTIDPAIDHRDDLAGRDKRERSQEQSGALSTKLMIQGSEGSRITGGLPTSRWASSNYGSWPNNAGRTNTNQTQRDPLPPGAYNVPTTSSFPALNLPYEVQHYILTMIERILEEGCFEFAMRWEPEALWENNWTCAEAVELSTWKSFLLTSMPPEAISSVRLDELEDALVDAVRVRNAAVHRHLCDNVEIRRMAIKA